MEPPKEKEMPLEQMFLCRGGPCWARVVFSPRLAGQGVAVSRSSVGQSVLFWLSQLFACFCNFGFPSSASLYTKLNPPETHP